jgi:hypothetical protein
VQHRRHAAAHQLPRGLAARKAAADDMNWPQFPRHAGKLCLWQQHDNMCEDERMGVRC